jgi:tetratricopeptide (TPR) repeat protein
MKQQRKQDLKHDEFVDTLAWLWETMKQYQQEILIGVVVALLLVGGGMYILNRWQRSREQAWLTLATIDQSVAPRRFLMEPRSPETALAAAKSYQDLAANYPRSAAAPLALLRAGKLLHEANRLDEALAVFNRLIADYPSADLAPAAQEAKACLLEDKKQYAEALALHQKVAESGPKHLSAECFLNAARCAQLTNDPARAKAFYEKAIAAAPGSLLAQFAEERLKIMALPPPAPPASKKQG